VEAGDFLVGQGPVEHGEASEPGFEGFAEHAADRVAGADGEVGAAAGFGGGVLGGVVGEDAFVVEVGVDPAMPAVGAFLREIRVVPFICFRIDLPDLEDAVVVGLDPAAIVREGEGQPFTRR